MPKPAPMNTKTRMKWTIALAASVLIVPPLLARFGPDSVRRGLHALQRGVFFDAAGAEELEFDRLHVDFGTLAKGKETKIEFSFENRSAQPVTITRTWTTCGCVRVDVPEPTVPAGQSGKIVLHVSAEDRLKGSMWQLAKIYTDKAPKMPYVLMVEGAVE